MLPGCVPQRDFRLGRTNADNMIDATTRSHKVILVVTLDFLSGVWAQYSLHPGLMAAVTRTKERGGLIVLGLETGAVLQGYETLEFTKRPINWHAVRKMLR
jgi:hypothetical protein